MIPLVLINDQIDVVLASLLFIVGVAVLLLITRRVLGKKKGEIPGKLGVPFLGETLSFLAATNSTKGCYDFVRIRRLEYGNWFKTRILGNTHVFCPSVEGAKMVYKNDFGLFSKRLLKSMGDLAGRKSLFVVNKGSHEKIRRLLTEPFSMNNVAQYVPKFDEMVSEKLNKFERQGKSFPMLEFTMKIGFDVLCETLLSITDEVLLDQLERDCSTIYDALLTFPLMIPGTKYYIAMKARKRVMGRFKAIISDRRSGKTSADDFLQSMLERDSYPDDERLEDEEIIDNLLTSLLSGRNTTATAMMWTVKYLSDNSKVQEKLRDEHLSILRKMPDGALLSYEDVNKMSYASKVIKETLRMSNIVLWFPRVASDDCIIEGHEIKKGWNVNVDACHIHYDPKIHKDPMHFEPSRFDEIPKPYTYMPFGSGPRTCLGINMAKVTMLVFLHRLASGYTWTLDDHDPSLECKGFIPKLRSGCPITLRALDHSF